MPSNGAMILPSEGQAFDVAICGGGLAGLTLARQLRLEIPDCSVVVIDKLTRPLPEAAFKVGEATVESATHYLCEILQLREYITTQHVRKLGFRFFFGDPHGPFHERPELGLADFATVPSFQLDRGILENDLRRFNEESGVVMLEGYSTEDIELAQGDDLHEVVYAAVGGDSRHRLRARWVVDSMGRRRFLQKKLNLTKDHEKRCSAAWFRLPGRIDVSDLVPESEREWHDRVPDRKRYLSTTHLPGPGYWIWIIPLSSGHTSVGIVALEDMYDFSTYNTYERALSWLRDREPTFASYIADREPLDFRCMRRYTYSSRQLFSTNRWACIGDAAVFADPFYALATDLMSFSNCFTTDLVRRDRADALTSDIVKRYNLMILSLNNWETRNIQLGYPFLDNLVVTTAKLIWDTAAGWAHLGPQLFNELFLQREVEAKVRKVQSTFFPLMLRMQSLFADWGSKSSGRGSYDFVPYLDIPLLSELQVRNLRTGKSAEELIEDQRANMRLLEELAQAVFLLAVEDTMPELLSRFEAPVWLNAWAISLNPTRWEEDGLFAPGPPPRDLDDVRQQIRGLFRFESQEVGATTS